MITRLKLVAVLASAALSAQAAAQASPDAKMWNGAWHLNAAKSKFSAAGKEQSETRTYEFSGGKLTMKSTSSRGGKSLTYSYSAAFDGKYYPMVGNPNADSISLSAVNGREIKAKSRLHGKLTVQSRASVSADGKHLTLTRAYIAMKGWPRDVLAFDR